MTTATTTDLCFTSAAELLAGFRAGTLSPVEVTEAVLARIGRLNPALHAFLYVDADGALRAARAAEAAYRAGNAGALAGVPTSIKDLVQVRGMPMTYGSLLYKDYVPEADAWSVARLRAAGAVLLGKTNTPEFGSLPTNENRLGESARNPWNLGCTPGGSSGGAGAAVAAGLGPLALGTDFGGSIRIPAAMCGVPGFKPSLGRIARDTSFNLTGEFFSHEGPLARSVHDLALYMDGCAGPDVRDPFSQIGPAAAFAENVDALPRNLRVAWTPDLGYARCDGIYLEVCERAVRRFEGAVGTIAQAAPEGAGEGLEAWRVAGAAGNFSAERAALQREHAEDLTPVVRHGLQELEKTSLLQYFDALIALRQWRRRAATFFDQHDLLLTPALPNAAIPIGARTFTINGEEQPNTFGLIAFTAPFNGTGQPVASMPCGFTPDGLPVAVQIAGRFGDDLLVLQAARAFELAIPEGMQRPPFDG
ncbi:MAG TPA: amidase family protein [Dehalococcoidia bacterium]|nr:amidase family protein [Dehalococcoidia bacterium]